MIESKFLLKMYHLLIFSNIITFLESGRYNLMTARKYFVILVSQNKIL